MRKYIASVFVVLVLLASGIFVARAHSKRQDTPPSAPSRVPASVRSEPVVVSKSYELIERSAAPSFEERKRAQSKAIEDGLKLYKEGAFGRTYARLSPILSQSGLSAADIDRSVSLYMDISFAKTREEREALIDKLKAEVGTEVYEGIERAEDLHRNRVRDDGLLAALKKGIPSVGEAEISAVTDRFERLPNYNTLFMQEVKFKPASEDVATNIQSTAGAYFDKAFADSPISPATRQLLRQTYVSVAVSMAPKRRN